MEDIRYGMRIQLPTSYEDAIERTTAALKSEGFGVLTTIDVAQTFKQKLGKDFPKYSILGACHPPTAYRALSTETEIGLLLPCNLIVYEAGAGHSVVAAVAPMATIGRAGTEALAPLGKEVDAKLRRVMAILEDAGKSI